MCLPSPASAPLLREKSTQEMEAYFDSHSASRDKIIATRCVGETTLGRRVGEVIYFSSGLLLNNFFGVSSETVSGIRHSGANKWRPWRRRTLTKDQKISPMRKASASKFAEVSRIIRPYEQFNSSKNADQSILRQ